MTRPLRPSDESSAQSVGLVHLRPTQREREKTRTGASGAVDNDLADVADLEDGGGLDVVPVLAGEGVNPVGKNEPRVN